MSHLKKCASKFDDTRIKRVCDGAKICELVGTYMLSLVKYVNYGRKDIRLYEGDGLGVCQNMRDPRIGRIRKDFQ